MKNLIQYSITMTPGSQYQVIVSGKVIAVKDTYTKAVRAANKATRAGLTARSTTVA